jgi:hypothetical protein
MAAQDEYTDEPATVFEVMLDDLTVARLIEISDLCHADPATVIASIVRDVLEDDARMHAAQTTPGPGLRLQ